MGVEVGIGEKRGPKGRGGGTRNQHLRGEKSEEERKKGRKRRRGREGREGGEMEGEGGGGQREREGRARAEALTPILSSGTLISRC